MTQENPLRAAWARYDAALEAWKRYTDELLDRVPQGGGRDPRFEFREFLAEELFGEVLSETPDGHRERFADVLYSWMHPREHQGTTAGVFDYELATYDEGYLSVCGLRDRADAIRTFSALREAWADVMDITVDDSHAQSLTIIFTVR